MPNPFRFGAPVDGEQFAGRKLEVRELVVRAKDHVNVAVISPRRFGKTSLVNEVCARVARSPGAAVARVNAMAANDDIGTFASHFVSAVYAGRGPWHKAKDSLAAFLGSFRQFQPTVTVGTEGPAFSFSAETVRRDPAALLGSAYRLLEHNDTAVVFVDEFQELVRMPGNVPALFKSLADACPQVSLIIAGSKEHMMRGLATDSRGPLYGMMHVVQLGPIADTEMGDYVERRFNVGGKPITRGLADRIVSLAGPVPNDVQHLAYDVYAAVESNRDVHADDVTAGMQAAVDQESGAFIDTFAALTGNQRMVLTALAVSPSANPQSAQFLARTGYANPSGVKRALKSLGDADIIALRAGRWTVVNPFLCRWLAGQSR